MSRRRDSYDIGSVIVFVPSSSLCVILIDNKQTFPKKLSVYSE